MATLDDKLLGEKLHYYCSSSEDEAGAADSDHDPAEDGADGAPAPPPPQAWSGAAANLLENPPHAEDTIVACTDSQSALSPSEVAGPPSTPRSEWTSGEPSGD
ncbi:Phosducin-like protein [Amphibalanus amphitrite]|uniref:Phosducin-like protein n=1 Tax=Amphibalanus amphitrite TaxID=1232801 RepID=A0A6A4XBC8_AMPAM|nr:Phosducin-like protein [Amphibalanus amphitrite]